MHTWEMNGWHSVTVLECVDAARFGLDVEPCSSHARLSNAFMLTSTAHLEQCGSVRTSTQRDFSASSVSLVFSTAVGPALFAHERYVSAETHEER
jgi:hypothetical protein